MPAFLFLPKPTVYQLISPPGDSTPVRAILLPVLALLCSCFIFYLGFGLVNILLPVRMKLEGISTDTIGLVLSLYAVGLLIGALYSKKLVQRIGHIRLFVGSITIEAITILALTLDPNPYFWGAMRVILGFSQATLLTAMESWLSDSATEETRGKVLGIYNATILVGLLGGQFLIGLAPPNDDILFIIAGMLLCFAALPVLFSRNQGPIVEDVAPMSVFTLFKISPLGVITCLGAGIVYSAILNMLPVFAADYDISGFQLSLFMGSTMVGAFLLQFPVGYLSDRMDRRTLLLVLLILSGGAGLSATFFAETNFVLALFISTSFTAGVIACYYPISIAEAFDKLKKSEMVSAMGSMILAFGLGSAIGPYTVALVMDELGSASLFYYLAVVQGALALFTLYRMSVRKALPVDEQEGFIMQAPSAAPVADLDPRTEYIEPEQPLSSEAETAVSVAETDPAAAVKMARALTMKNPEKGTEVAAAVAQVPGIDVMRLYEVMKEAAPYQILEITRAIVNAKPELSYDLVSQLAEWHPQQVVPVAIEIGRALPDYRVEMAKVAVNAAPESATQVAEYYASVMAEEREQMRPADRDDDTSEQDAYGLVSELWEAAPEQALDVATTVASAVPEAIIPLTEEYLSEGEIAETDSEQDNASADPAEDESEDEQEKAIEWLKRMAELSPETSLDLAVKIVETMPETAVTVAAEVAKTMAEQPQEEVQEQEADNKPFTGTAVEETSSEDGLFGDLFGSDEDTETNQAVELVNRITEIVPDSVEDVAAAVVESLPEAASDVVDAISKGDEATEGEWVNNIDDRPEDFVAESSENDSSKSD